MRRGVQVRLRQPQGWGPRVRAQLSPTPCPVPTAFHEMCRDEYVMLMTWKRAAAGEIIYNKCPPNASGKGRWLSPKTLAPPSLLPASGPKPWVCISRCGGGVGWSSALMPVTLISAGSASRRCLLSAQGVAYWGLPSFARCISHEYRYLYLSVSVHGWTGCVWGYNVSQALAGA